MSRDQYAEFLFASSGRIEILKCLHETPRSPRDLADVISISHRAVQRNLSALVEKEWVRKTKGEYHLTKKGTVITTEALRFIDNLNLYDDYEDLLCRLPDQMKLPTLQWFRDAELVLGDSNRPQAPAEYTMSSLEDISTNTIRGMTPILTQAYIHDYENSSGRDVETHIILDESLIEVLRSEYPHLIETMHQQEKFNLYLCEISFKFGFLITDEQVFLCGYDEKSWFCVCVKSKNRDLLNWTENIYRDYRNRARVIESQGSSD